jgi:PAP2 superfamily
MRRGSAPGTEVGVSKLSIALLASTSLGLSGCTFFADFLGQSDDSLNAATEKWNIVARDTSGLDHTPVAAGESRTFGHQLGPGASSRAMAITHLAMFDAANAILGGYESYTRISPADPLASVPAAIAQAAYDTLVALYPSHAARLTVLLAESLDEIPDGPLEDGGRAVGAEAAAAILALRDGDGSTSTANYVVSDQPGKWRADPINPNQQPLGEEWPNVKPFAINSAAQFRSPPPPAMDSMEYTAAYLEVLALGGDGELTPTIRTPEQTQIGIYWAYDGTPSLCAPPRLYNQIAAQIAEEQGVSGLERLRLLTLVNVAMADAGIAIWESKYFYNVWRPVTGIREADVGTGPTGLGDGNPFTLADPTFVPLCAPASNLAGKNFTPPFPAYPSGHAGFGAALFETLRRELGRDEIAFTFVSDEYNGVTRDNEGNVRPLVPRSFSSLSEAEEENGQSRIYLGIHWVFDKTEGIAQGRKVARKVADSILAPN